MQTFKEIYQRAAERKGEPQLKARMSEGIKERQPLTGFSDARLLAEITKAIFKAGFQWKIIDYKWQGFEEAFWGFDIARCAFMSPDDEDRLCSDTRIIRNRRKILTVPHNAVMISEAAREHGSFGAFLNSWGDDDFIGLLAWLNKYGSRLGPMTAQYFLRFVGKDGFILSTDGVQALIAADAIDKPSTSKATLKKIQQSYNQWQQESGLSLTEISRVLAMSVHAPQETRERRPPRD